MAEQQTPRHRPENNTLLYNAGVPAHTKLPALKPLSAYRANRLSLKKKPSKPSDASIGQPAPSSNAGAVVTPAHAAELAAAQPAASASTYGSSAAQAEQLPSSYSRQAGNAAAAGGGSNDQTRHGWAGRRFKPPGLLGGSAGATSGAPAQRAWAPSKKKDLASFDLLDELPDLAGLPDLAADRSPSQPAPAVMPAAPAQAAPACGICPKNALLGAQSGLGGSAYSASQHGAPAKQAEDRGAPPGLSGRGAAAQQPRQCLSKPFKAPRPLVGCLAHGKEACGAEQPKLDAPAHGSLARAVCSESARQLRADPPPGASSAAHSAAGEAAQLGTTEFRGQQGQELRQGDIFNTITAGQAAFERMAEQAHCQMRQAAAASRMPFRDDNAILSCLGLPPPSRTATAEPMPSAAAPAPAAQPAPAGAFATPVHGQGPSPATGRSCEPRQEEHRTSGCSAEILPAATDAHAAGMYSEDGDCLTAGSGELASKSTEWQDGSTPQVSHGAHGRTAAAGGALGSGRKTGVGGGRSTERRRKLKRLYTEDEASGFQLGMAGKHAAVEQASQEDGEDSDLLVELNLRGPALAVLRAEPAALLGSRLNRASQAAPNTSASKTHAAPDTLDAFAALPDDPVSGKDAFEETARPRASLGSAGEGRYDDACWPDEAEPLPGRSRKLKRLRRAGDAAQPSACTSDVQGQAGSAAEGAPKGINASRRAPADWSEDDGDDGGQPRKDVLSAGPAACAAKPRSRANPFVSKASAAMGMEPKLACHARAQPLAGPSPVSAHDLSSVLYAPPASRQGAREGDGVRDAVIDLADSSDDDKSSPQAKATAQPPAQRRVIRLPAAPASLLGKRTLPATSPDTGQPAGQGAAAQPHQHPPRHRSYLGAYSAAAMYAAAAQHDENPAAEQRRFEGTYSAPKTADDRAATAAQDGRNEEVNGRGGKEGLREATWQPNGSHRQQWDNGAACQELPADEGAWEDYSGGGFEGHGDVGQMHNGGGGESWRQLQGGCGARWRTEERPVEQRPLSGHANYHEAGPSGSGRGALSLEGPPWWHRLPDFVPVAALRNGRDPRDGSIVHIDYTAQFSGAAPARGGNATARRKGHSTMGRGEGSNGMEPNEAGAQSNQGYWKTEYQRNGPVKVYYTMRGARKTGTAAYQAAEKEKNGLTPPSPQAPGSSGGRHKKSKTSWRGGWKFKARRK